jgi:hypothetical protein
MNKWEFARRDLLKQLGVGLAILPALNHSRAWAAGTAPPKKLLVFLASEGYRMAQWKPTVGALGTLPQSCLPLTRHKDGLVFLPDMANPGFTGGVPDGHQAYGTIFWGGSKVAGSGKPKTPPAGGSTVDQFIAAGLPKMKYDSIVFALQLEKPPKQTVVGQNRCFFKSGGAVTPMENPQTAYASLYAGIGSMMPGPGAPPVDDTKTRQLLARKKSLLDYVGKSLDKFKVRVAKEDRSVIDNHLSSIRDLEGTLTGIGEMPVTGGPACNPMDPGKFTDADVNSSDAAWPLLLHAFMNMMIAGVACDLTNVAGLQVADSTGDQVNFGAFVQGIPARNATNYKTSYRNWHDLGHNPNMTVDGKSVDHHRMVDEWCMNELSLFLDKVKAVPGPTGTLFDNSITLWGNHMEDGLTHNSQKIPWILAGKAGGKLNGGICANTSGKNIQAAMADICTAMGVPPADPFVGSIPGVVKA